MSPRSTHALHELGELAHFSPVIFVGLKSGDLGSQRGTLPEATCAVEDRPAYSLGPADACRLKLRECLQSLGVQANADSRRHTRSVSRSVVHAKRFPWGPVSAIAGLRPRARRPGPRQRSCRGPGGRSWPVLSELASLSGPPLPAAFAARLAERRLYLYQTTGLGKLDRLPPQGTPSLALPITPPPPAPCNSTPRPSP